MNTINVMNPSSSQTINVVDSNSGESQEMRYVKSKIRQLEMGFEDFLGKLLLRGQDAKDMDKHVDAMSNDV